MMEVSAHKPEDLTALRLRMEAAKQALFTIDAGVPTSNVAAIPATSTSSIALTWSGQDDAGGSGIASYDNFFSDNGGAFQPFLTGTPLTSLTFLGTIGHTYSFYSVAVDNAGNREATPTSAQATTTVAGTPTTTVLASLNASVFGQSVTFAATVSPTTPGAGTPTGTVTFLDGTTTLGTGTLNVSDVATFTTTAAMSVGSHSITAVYSGDTVFNTSTSSAATQTVNQASVTTTLSALSASVFGESVTFTATVTPVLPGAGTLTGTVAFMDGTTTLGTGTLNGPDIATFRTTTALGVGSHSISAVYSGDTDFTTSTSSTATQAVNPGSTSTTLSGLTASVFGQTFTLTATVLAIAPGAGTPTGTVAFLDGTTTLGTGSLNGSDVATFSTAALNARTHLITSSYLIGSDFVSSVSRSLSLSIGRATASVSLISSSNLVTDGQSITLISTIIVTTGTMPTGAIVFLDGTTTLGLGSINSSGVAKFTGSLSAGTRSISASYTGDANHTSAGSTPLNLVVNSPSTSTSVSLSSGTIAQNSSVTFTATVSAAGRSPSGPVIFEGINGSDTITLGTSTLNGTGTVTFTTSSLSVGHYNVSAVYQGGSSFPDSTSGSQLLLVGTNDQRYVNQLYIDLFNRNADPAGLAAWSGVLDNNTQTRTQVATALTSSREYDGIVVDALYFTYLGRHAETIGLNAWVDQMQKGLNAEVIRAGILGSDEYYNRTGPNNQNGTDTTFVTALYKTFLGRAPTPPVSPHGLGNSMEIPPTGRRSPQGSATRTKTGQ